MLKVGVVGGGAAGFFAAIHAKINFPEATVHILEKSTKVLSKVKVSGGGRCNVTNAQASISELAKAYPRGGKQLKKVFPTFYTKHTIDWFESRGVELVIQEDQCIFPKSQDAQTIIDCFFNEVNRLGIHVKTSCGVSNLSPCSEGIELTLSSGEVLTYNKVILATGGSPKLVGLEWLERLGHKIESPVPSLFTFNMPSESIRDLMGVVVENAQTKIKGEKLSAFGPLLITHWGMSGPAILVLSSFGALLLAEKNYEFVVQVNWVNETNHNKVYETLAELSEEHNAKQIQNIRPYFLPTRLWHFLLVKGEIPLDRKWGEIGKKGLNKLLQLLTNDEYQVKGKTTFKEEFVTCGGVSLDSINMKTMESNVIPNLYFAGELMDIDAITGGYNFQAAWTTGFIAGKLLDGE